MPNHPLTSWLKKLFRTEAPPRARRKGAPLPRRPRFVPLLEALETRLAPANLVVTSAADPATLTAGTLRYEINQANTDAAAGTSDAITFNTTAMGTGTITLSQGVLELTAGTGTTTILGAGQVTVSGNSASRVFLVDSGATDVLSGLTVENGHAIASGAGVLNNGTLTLIDSTLSNNKAILGGGSIASGGGIANTGTLTLSNSTLSRNSAHKGGGIANSGTLTLSNSTLSLNTGIGGIYNSGKLTLSNSTLSDNGGGINNSATGKVTLSNSTVSGNDTSSGGGIFNLGTMTLSNSTVSGNSSGEDGGGILNQGTMTLSNSTVSGNSSHIGGGIANLGTLTLESTIVADNTATVSGPDILGGGTISAAYSLIGNGTDSGIANGGTNIVGSEPIFNPSSLANNGGPTQTLALASGPGYGQGGPATTVASPFITSTTQTTIPVANAQAIASTPGAYLIQIDGEDMLVTSVNLSTNMLTVVRGYNGTTPITTSTADGVSFLTDQRGYAYSTTMPDIGAYQSTGTAPATPTVSSISPSSGPVAGGTVVTITGTNLANATAVDFGALAGTIVSDSGTQIVALTPAEPAGTVDITVTTVGWDTTATSAADLYSFKATPSVSVTDAGGVYTGSAHPATATVNDQSSLETVTPTLTYYSGTYTLSNLPGSGGSSSAPSSAGCYTVVAAFAGSADYYSASALANFTIGQAALTVTATGSQTYGGANQSFTPSYSGFVTGDGPGVVSGTPLFSTTATAGSPVSGSYTASVTVSGLSAANYSFVAGTPGTFAVNPAVLTVTATGSQTYGGTNQSFTPSYSGFVTGDGSGVVSGTPLFSTTATAGSPVSGSYTASVTVSGLSAANYTFVAGTPGTFAVNPAVLTVTATGSQTYGGTNQSFTPGYSGFVNGDGPGVVSGTPLFSTTATAGSPVSGSYTASVDVSGLSAANYTFVAGAPGTYTVIPGVLTVTATGSQTYGGANQSFTPSYSGFVNGEGSGVVSGTPLFSTTATAGSPVSGSYTASVTVSGLSAANYTFVAGTPGTFAVNPAVLTVTATGSQTYGGTNQSFTPSYYSGFVNGDGADVVGGTPQFSTSATASSPVSGSYTASVDVSGLSAANYTFVAGAPGTYTVIPGVLTVTATGSQTYGGANQSFTPSYSGFVNGEGSGVVSGTPLFSTTATAGSPVSGSYTASVTVSGLSAANYTFVAGTPGTFAVNPAVLTVTATGSQTYGGTNQSFTPSYYSGFVNGDGADVVGGTPQFSTSATASSPVSGSYTASVNVAGLSAANYTFVAGAPGTFTVIPAALTVTGSGTQVYGGSPSYTAGYYGFVNGDSASSLTGTLSLATAATTGSAVGTYPVTPSGVSSANYSITFVSGTLFVTPAPLTISADSKTRVYGQANPSFTASYYGFVNDESASSLAGTLSLTTTATTGSGVGSYPVTPGGVTSSNYSITFVSGTLFVLKAVDTITLSPTRVVPLGSGPITLNATGGGSSSPVVYTVLHGPGSVHGDLLTVTALGTIMIKAGQAGDANYTAAIPVMQTVQVEKAQTITFTQPASPIAFTTTPIALSASASSALAVTFKVISGPGTLNGTQLTVTGVGSIVIEADQAGNATYAPASPVQRTIVVNKANQTITFATPAARAYSATPITLAATTSSGLPIAYSVASGPGQITGSQLTITGVGSIVIDANQAGNSDYNAAAQVARTLVVSKASQTITFQALNPVTYGAGPITLGATASAGLAVSYGIVSGHGTLNGNQLTITGAGAIVIKATQAGNADYSAATAVTQTLTVNKATLTVTANNATWTAGQSGQSLDGFTITGFVDGDTQASLFPGEAAVVSCPTVNASHPVVNTYVILIGQGTLVAPANYMLVFKTGKLTVQAVQA